MRLRLGAELHTVVRRSENSFDVDGASVRVSVTATGSGTSSFEGQTESRRIPVFVVRDGERVFAKIGARSYALDVVAREAAATSAFSAARGALEAPMPGRVTRIAVSVGDTVKRGQELIVVEAMKMENALVAPEDGVIKSLSVTVGDLVIPGLSLVVMEPSP